MRHLIHAEWTKFRTVRGWVIGMLAAIGLTVLVGLLGPAGSSMNCAGPHGESCANNLPTKGPSGVFVQDANYLVHRTLTGDGSITARVGDFAETPEQWTKAGVMFKQGDKEGTPYVLVARTGAHGVHMQHNFTGDVAGPSDTDWVRLSRSGDTVTAYTSSDGEQWTTLGTARLTGVLTAGMVVASPPFDDIRRTFGSIEQDSGPTVATVTFDRVTVTGDWGGDWRGRQVGGGEDLDTGYTEDAGRFTVSGTGDISPVVPGAAGRGRTVENALVGAFTGLIAVLVVATMFVTGEHRRGLIRTSLAASPRRGQLLAAKAVVMGGVSFVTGAVAAGLAVPLVESVEVEKGMYLYPTSFGTELRVILGTGALFAVAAVLAVAVGSVLRRGAGTVTAMVVAVVLPYLLAVASVLPPGPADWLTSLTPAAAFAIQQSVIEYPQVSSSYTTAEGYFPLSPAGGFAVLCVYAAVAVAVATVLLRRRDV